MTVASRISGLIGNSSNPISGMTIATLMATCAVFLVMHWTANSYAVLALTIGGVVCIASAIAGATSQDLKTGYLVGATPMWQQIGAHDRRDGFVVCHRRHADPDERGLAQYKPIQIALDINHLPNGSRAAGRQLHVSGQDVRAGECNRIGRNSRRQVSLRSVERARSKFSGCRGSAARRRRRRKRG